MNRSSILQTLLKNQLCTFMIIHLIIICAANLQLANQVVAGENVDRIKTSGWTAISDKWPVGARDYYVATEKGHHFVEVKLPEQLETDLTVKLEYFYNFAKVKPVIQVVPCKSNREVDEEGESVTRRGQWIIHEIRVKKEDCKQRNELNYNVLLHDPNDVFAWKQLVIKSIEPTKEVQPVPESPVDTSSNPSAEVNSQTNTESNSEPTSNILPEPGHQSEIEPEPQSQPQPQPEALVISEDSSEASQSNKDSTTEKTSSDEPNEDVEANETIDNMIENSSQQASTSSPEHLNTDVSTEDDIGKKLLDKLIEYHREAGSADEEESDNDQVDIQASRRPPPPEISERPFIPEDLVDKYVKRIKRQADEPIRLKEICKPSSCNKNLIRMARFMPIVKGLPQVSQMEMLAGKKFFFAQAVNKSQDFEIESSDDLSELNTCIKFKLFMDPDTKLDFLLSDGAAAANNNRKDGKLLETIHRKITDSGSGNWSTLRRCISDYMPSLKNAAGDSKEVHKVKLSFIPRDMAGGKRIAMLLDPGQTVELRESFPALEYLPNVQSLENVDDFHQYWRMEKDMFLKPEVHFSTIVPSQGKTKRNLAITKIDPRQGSLDLTSRWLKIKDVESLENPVFFIYKADRAAWIKSIDFEFQRAGGQGDNWTSKEVYVAPPPTEGASSVPTPSETDQSAANEQPVKGAGEESNKSPSTVVEHQQLLLPIKVKGLTSNEEFRLRIRHHIKEGAPLFYVIETHQLQVATLAFGDACAESSYCVNGGKCISKGTAKAECRCAQGYSGRHCEKGNPCEVVYGDKTGSQLCQSVGASCAQNIPVYRCVWPNDRFFQCKALQENITDQLNELVEQPAAVQVDNDELAKLKEKTNKQAELIIVLSVFMVALLLFSVVLVGSMVSRLMKAKNRLKDARIEVQELTLRPQASTSAGAIYGRPSLSRPAATVYNNQAFDQ